MAWAGWDKEEEPKTGALERIAALGAAALGLVGFLYALGGVVIWLRMQAAQLTPSGIVALSDRHLLEVGVSVVAFELFLLLSIGLIVASLVAARILLWKHRGAASREDRPRLNLGTAAEDAGTLAGIVLPTIALTLFTVGLAIPGSPPARTLTWIAGVAILAAAALGMIFLQIERFAEWVTLTPWQWLAGLLLPVAMTLGIFVLPLLQGTILLAGTALAYLGPFLRWPEPKTGDVRVAAVLRSTGLWVAIALTTVVALAWVATPPVSFTHARLNSLNREHPHEGAYLDRGDGGVYIGTCVAGDAGEDGRRDSAESRVILVPGEESARLRLGQETYHFDPGGRPSLWQTFKTVVGGGIPGAHDAPLDHPLRGQVEHVCGGGS
jgi:hypothetical protein